VEERVYAERTGQGENQNKKEPSATITPTPKAWAKIGGFV
jgi:hypothetical protein